MNQTLIYFQDNDVVITNSNSMTFDMLKKKLTQDEAEALMKAFESPQFWDVFIQSVLGSLVEDDFYEQTKNFTEDFEVGD